MVMTPLPKYMHTGRHLSHSKNLLLVLPLLCLAAVSLTRLDLDDPVLHQVDLLHPSSHPIYLGVFSDFARFKRKPKYNFKIP